MNSFWTTSCWHASSGCRQAWRPVKNLNWVASLLSGVDRACRWPTIYGRQSCRLPHCILDLLFFPFFWVIFSSPIRLDLQPSSLLEKQDYIPTKDWDQSAPKTCGSSKWSSKNIIILKRTEIIILTFVFTWTGKIGDVLPKGWNYSFCFPASIFFFPFGVGKHTMDHMNHESE